jgi:hypothetical protein
VGGGQPLVYIYVHLTLILIEQPFSPPLTWYQPNPSTLSLPPDPGLNLS